MMMMTPVLDTVRELFAEHTSERGRLFDAAPDAVSLQSLGIDSVEMMSIVMELEDRFDIRIDETRLYEIATLADLVRVLESKRSGER